MGCPMTHCLLSLASRRQEIDDFGSFAPSACSAPFPTLVRQMGAAQDQSKLVNMLMTKRSKDLFAFSMSRTRSLSSLLYGPFTKFLASS